ncbi:hypothetical protein [Candidatus Palauibacter sp.]|uniref:hypothetical protein n=1 Tax=Candidatus Palauibacter sp. TaxID=3101350 RepID=UPI003B5BFC84
MSKRESAPPDIAYYYPAPYWSCRESDWVKSLLLFFDQVAILLPAYMYGRHLAADPTLVEPLEDRGLLQILDPNDWVGESMSNQLAEIIVELLTNGAFDDLSTETRFHELSYSRLGYSADVELASFLVEELRARDLARPSEDGVSVPLHPTVRTTILVILGQLSRVAGSKAGLSFHPTTNSDHAIQDLVTMLSREPMPSAGQMIALDLEPVSLNLGSIPLDDVLQFRTERRDAHRTYMRNLQWFMAELANISIAEEREAMLLERRQEIAASAFDLRRSTARAFRKNLASWSLGLAGGAWSLSTGDAMGVVLAACSRIPELFGGAERVTAYSYMFSVQQKLGA